MTTVVKKAKEVRNRQKF